MILVVVMYEKARCYSASYAYRVTAHFVTVEGRAQPRTTMLLKFDASVLEREKRLQATA